MNISKLQQLVKECGKSKVQIAKLSGITRVTLDNALQGGDIRISIVEALAKTLGVSVGYLFDDTSNNTVHTNGDFSPASMHGNVSVGGGALLAERVKYLEQLLAEKERLIKVLIERK